VALFTPRYGPRVLAKPLRRSRLSAFGAHSAFSVCANAEPDTTDHHTDIGRGAFLGIASWSAPERCSNRQGLA
jgi:hypothetical protein